MTDPITHPTRAEATAARENQERMADLTRRCGWCEEPPTEPGVSTSMCEECEKWFTDEAREGDVRHLFIVSEIRWGQWILAVGQDTEALAKAAYDRALHRARNALSALTEQYETEITRLKRAAAETEVG